MLILISILLCACGKDDIKLPEQVTYYNNMSVVGLAVNAEEELPNHPEFISIAEEVLGEVGGIALPLCESYVAKKAEEDDRLDEYGIFHCAEGKSVDALYQSVLDYVNTRKNDQATLSHYEDAATVKNGKIALYGNYVVYTFLPDNGNNQFHTLVESLLTE